MTVTKERIEDVRDLLRAKFMASDEAAEEVCDLALRALDSEWRTIDSAPTHDGAEILGVRNGRVFALHWHAETKRWGGGPCWYDDVTHWMPLPPPPEVKP